MAEKPEMKNAVTLPEKRALTPAGAEEWALMAMQAGIVAPGTNPFQAKAIIRVGQEIGVQPFQALRCMVFIKGKLTMAVQMQLALARKSGVIVQKLESDNAKCTVTLKRGEESITTEYSIEDAKSAGLLKELKPCVIENCYCKGDPLYHGTNWHKYPRQMLRWRAIGDCLRLIAPDLVMGMLSPDEAEEEIPLTPSTVEEIKPLDLSALKKPLLDTTIVGGASAPNSAAVASPVPGSPETLADRKRRLGDAILRINKSKESLKKLDPELNAFNYALNSRECWKPEELTDCDVAETIVSELAQAFVTLKKGAKK